VRKMGCSLVNDIRPAARIVQDVVREAEEVIAQLHRGKRRDAASEKDGGAIVAHNRGP
jgi:hypothetical protein